MTIKLLAGATLALAATVAAAQAPAQGGDGVQTRAEAAQRVQAMFGRIDGNRDGFLTQEEAQQAHAALRGQRAARRADPARQAQRAERTFERIDGNRDGSISRQEWAQHRAARGERGQRGGRMAGLSGLGGQMFAMADANRDNRVSLQEATGAALRHFDQLDRNRDGQLTRDERQAWRAQRRG